MNKNLEQANGTKALFEIAQKDVQPTLFPGNKNVRDIKKFRRFDYTIHPIKTVDKLLEEEGETELRFSQMPNYEARFGREGVAGHIIPPHFLLVSEKATPSSALVITAGMITFIKQPYQPAVVKKINHESGDHRPLFESLKWFLATLIINNVAFSDDFIIEQLDTSGGLITKHKVDLQALKEELSPLMTPKRREAMINNNQRAEPYHFVKKTERREIDLDDDDENINEQNSPTSQRFKAQSKRPSFILGPDRAPLKYNLTRAHAFSLAKAFEDASSDEDDLSSIQQKIKF